MIKPEEIVNFILNTLEDKMAQDIKLLHTADVTILADYFIICTATSTTHMKTLSDFLDVELKRQNINPHRREGEKSSEWMLIDCGAVIVHIFLESGREHYKLEQLWNEAEEIDIESIK